MSETNADRYPTEVLSEEGDDGTMPDNVAALAESIVGHKIVSVEQRPVLTHGYRDDALVITLDSGHQVVMRGSSDWLSGATGI